MTFQLPFTPLESSVRGLDGWKEAKKRTLNVSFSLVKGSINVSGLAREEVETVLNALLKELLTNVAGRVLTIREGME